MHIHTYILFLFIILLSYIHSHGLSIFHIAFTLSFLYALCSHSILKFSTKENNSTKTSKLIIQWNGNETFNFYFAGMENGNVFKYVPGREISFFLILLYPVL